jgi:formate dehydrogenase assembly factor FdhD
MSAKRFLTRRIKRISGTNCQAVPDHLALEEPLEIQVAYGPESARQWKTVAITMRTPGHDRELASGIPMLVAVGAPSSVAVEVAEKFGASLIGFTKPNGFNIYTGEERVSLGASEPVTHGALGAHFPV